MAIAVQQSGRLKPLQISLSPFIEENAPVAKSPRRVSFVRSNDEALALEVTQRSGYGSVGYAHLVGQFACRQRNPFRVREKSEQELEPLSLECPRRNDGCAPLSWLFSMNPDKELRGLNPGIAREIQKRKAFLPKLFGHQWRNVIGHQESAVVLGLVLKGMGDGGGVELGLGFDYQQSTAARPQRAPSDQVSSRYFDFSKTPSR